METYSLADVFQACAREDLDHLTQMLQKVDGKRLPAENAFAIACYLGKDAVISCFVNMGPKFNKELIATGFVEACIGGQRGVVERLVKLADEKKFTIVDSVWLHGLYAACERGHLDVIEKLSTLAAQKGMELDWGWGMSAACASGRDAVAVLMLQKGAKNGWLTWLADVARYNHAAVTKALLTHLPPNQPLNVGRMAFLAACATGQLELAKFVQDRCQFDNGEDAQVTLSCSLAHSVERGYKAVFTWLVEDVKVNLNRTLLFASRNRFLTAVEWLLAHGADNVRESLDALCESPGNTRSISKTIQLLVTRLMETAPVASPPPAKKVHFVDDDDE